MTIPPGYLTITQILNSNYNSGLLQERIEGVNRKIHEPWQLDVAFAHRAELTLEDYAFASEEMKAELEGRFELKGVIAQFEEYCNFRERLHRTALVILSQITLVSIARIPIVKTPINLTELWCGLIDAAWFCELSIKQMRYLKFPVSFLTARLDVIEKTEPELWECYRNQTKKPCFRLEVDFPIGQFRHFTGHELSDYAPKLCSRAFSLVTDEQFKGLNFVKLTPKQINFAIKGDGLAETGNRRVRWLLQMASPIQGGT